MNQPTESLIKEQKAILRESSHQRLKQMTEEEKTVKSALICRKITDLVNQLHPNSRVNIASFAANSLEPNLSSLHLSLAQHYLAYPICLKNKTLQFYSCTDYDSMLPGKYGILSPHTENQEAISAETFHIILVPGYAFTLSKARLGKGGGYYDKYLAAIHSANYLTIGICFSEQVIDSIPMSPHDIKINKLISDI